MGIQIITIRPDGSAHGLVHGKGKGLDLRLLGNVSVRRETLIELCEKRQAWGIRWTDPEKDAETPGRWDVETFREAGVPHAEFNGWCEPSPDPSDLPEFPVFFEHYEDAVQAEIAVIQALQLRGDFEF